MSLQPPPPPVSALARHRQLSPSASVRVSPLCLGAMNFGEAHKSMLGECSKETAFEILDHFVGQGGNFIDTASGYQDGESEAWIGEWMTARKNRDEMIVATKYTSNHMRYRKDKIQSNFGGNNVKSMRVSVDLSLEHLQTPYIDLLYVHWWDYTCSIPELMHALDDLIRAGKVLYLGISDTPAWVVAKANQYARDHGLRQFTVYQGGWSAAMRDFEREIIPMCRDEGMGLAPWGVLNSGNFQPASVWKEREDKTHEGRKMRSASEHDKRISQVLEDIANAKGTPLTHIALAYVMHKAPYVFPIVGGRKVEHLKGNIEALSVSLSKEEIEKIESAYEFNPGFPHTLLSLSIISGGPPVGAYAPQDVALLSGMAHFDFVQQPQPILPK